MITPDEIERRVATALGRSIQDPVYGNIDNSLDSPLTYHAYVKIEGQEETYLAPFDPRFDITKLADNTRVVLKYDANGVLAIVDWDSIAARESYPSPPTVNYALSQHTHQTAAQGGQLNASLVFNNGAVPVAYGGTNITSYAVGDLLYASAAGVLSKLAVGSNGNIYHVAGGLPVSGTLNLSTANLSGLLAYARGGLNADVSGITTGALLVKGASAASGLAPGTSGNIAQSNGSIWQSVAPSFAASVITSGQLLLERGGTEADLSATGAGHLIQATTGAAVSVIKDNFAATAAPNPATDDNTAGYAVGSLWLDTTNDDIYMAIDVSTGAAVWEQLNGAGAASPFTTTSNVIHQNTLTDAFAIGTNINSSSKVYILGDDTAEITTRIKGASGQSAALLLVEENGGDGFLTVSPSLGVVINQDDNAAGDFRARSQAGVTYIHADASAGTIALDGAVTINDSGADVDFRVESDTQANALFLDGATGAVQQLGNTPSAYLHMAASTTALSSGLIPQGVAPSSPVEGQFWNDSTQKSFKKRVNGLSVVDTQTLFTQVSTVSVSATTSETTLKGTLVLAGNDTLPANWWTVGKTFTFFMAGLFTVSSGTPTATLRIKFGSTALRAFTTPTLSGSFIPWTLSGSGTCQSVGATGNVFTSGNLITNNANTPGNTNATIDTTGSNALDVTIQPSTNNLTWTCSVLRIVIDN